MSKSKESEKTPRNRITEKSKNSIHDKWDIEMNEEKLRPKQTKKMCRYDANFQF